MLHKIINNLRISDNNENENNRIKKEQLNSLKTVQGFGLNLGLGVFIKLT